MDRNDGWLRQLLDDTWDQHFSDVPQDNIVRIVFGRRARNRLGSIRIDPEDHEVSIITINGHFRDPAVPEFLVKATIVHELSHYAHGFNSPVEQKYQHPHAGGVMRSEFRERGLEELFLMQRKWLKEEWRNYLESHKPRKPNRSTASGNKHKIPNPFWFLGE